MQLEPGAGNRAQSVGHVALLKRIIRRCQGSAAPCPAPGGQRPLPAELHQDAFMLPSVSLPYATPRRTKDAAGKGAGGGLGGRAGLGGQRLVEALHGAHFDGQPGFQLRQAEREEAQQQGLVPKVAQQQQSKCSRSLEQHSRRAPSQPTNQPPLRTSAWCGCLLLGAGPASFSSRAARSRAAAEAEAADRKNETMKRHMSAQLTPTTAAGGRRGRAGWKGHEQAGRHTRACLCVCAASQTQWAKQAVCPRRDASPTNAAPKHAHTCAVGRQLGLPMVGAGLSRRCSSTIGQPPEEADR